jgi:hypothetical protein
MHWCRRVGACCARYRVLLEQKGLAAGEQIVLRDGGGECRPVQLPAPHKCVVRSASGGQAGGHRPGGGLWRGTWSECFKAIVK